MANPYAHIKLYIMVTGKKQWPWVVMSTKGFALGYFKNSKDADRYCATDGQAFA